MSPSKFSLVVMFFSLLFLLAGPLPAEVKTEEQWSKLKASLWNELWGTDEDARVEAVRKIGEANYIKAVKILVELAKVPNPRLSNLEKAKKELLEKIAGIDRLINKNKGMITIGEKNDRDRMTIKVREINKVLFKERVVRREVRKGLSETTDPKSIEWLIGTAIKDRNPLVRELVARSFGYMTSPNTLSALHAAAGDKEPSVRSTVIDALGRRHQKESLDVIIPFLEDEHWQVRVSAVAAVGMYHDLKIVDPLIQALQNESGRLRGDIDAVLDKLLGRSMGGDYELWKSWWAANKAKIISGDSADEHGGGGAGAKTTSFYGIRTYSKNVMFIIDISGSMRHPGKIPEKEKRRGAGAVVTGPGAAAGPEPPIGDGPADETKMSIAKWELKKAIRGLEKGALFNIAYYNAEVKTYSPRMVKITRPAKAKVYRFIDRLEAVGMTNIHDALMKAFEASGKGKRAEKMNYKGSVDTIFFLTDGFATAGAVLDPERILEAVREKNRTRKIVIHTIGIYSSDEKASANPAVRIWKRFLKRLAEQNGGRHKVY